MKLLAVLLSLLVLPVVARAQPSPGSRVLVMPFAADVEAQAPGGAGTSLWLGEAASVLLGEGLANEGVGALTREERIAAFDRLQLPMSAALTRATMIRVAELTGASDLIFGEIELGETLRVRVRMIRVGPGSERPSVDDTATLPEIFTLFDRVSRRVADVTGRLRPRSARAMDKLPLEAFELYVKGLVAATPAVEQRFLENAMRIAPSDARIQLELWSVYSAQDLDDRALEAANAVPATSPLHRRARFAVAQSLIALKRYDGALHELEALHKAEGTGAISNAIGIVQLRRDAETGPRLSTTYFARAVRESPAETTYLFNLGYAHALAASNTDALTSLRETVRLDPTDGDAHLVMGAVLGRTPEGQRELELARALGASVDPTVATPGLRVPSGLERVELDLNVSSAARLVQAVPVQRDQQETAAFHLARARTLVEQRRDSEAIEALRRAIYLSPYADEPHLLLGSLYRRAGRLSEAIDAFKIAIWSRETASAHVALGQALLDAGDPEGAKRSADRALVLAPTSEPARELLKRLGG